MRAEGGCREGKCVVTWQKSWVGLINCGRGEGCAALCVGGWISEEMLVSGGGRSCSWLGKN